MVHHEFWPASLFYLPIYFYYLGQSIRFRSLNYFAWVNPGMKNGGMIGYSKYSILKKVPSQFVPTTLLIEKTQLGFNHVELKLREHPDLSFPVIVKPDQGARGFGVKLVQNSQELRDYHNSAKSDYLIQAYLDDPQEFGVFVVKTAQEFYVSSVTQKDFLILYGDGRSSMKELFLKHPRANKYFSISDLPLYNERVLEVGQKILLEPIGNHCRGTKFVNANSIIDDSLTSHFEKLCKSIPQFYYGRFDVKAASVAALVEGKFKIMEVNGASSEPGHIYDPNYKLRQAYKDLFWHWKKMSQIVAVNKKQYPKESLLTTVKTIVNYYLTRGSSDEN